VLKCEEILKAKPAINRAFQAAKKVSQSNKGSVDDEYITLSEFRVFLV